MYKYWLLGRPLRHTPVRDRQELVQRPRHLQEPRRLHVRTPPRTRRRRRTNPCTHSVPPVPSVPPALRTFFLPSIAPAFFALDP